MTLLHGNNELTSKEWAITALISQGRTNAEIAVEIDSTERAVDLHLRRISDKTGCWNRTEIALWYLKIGVEQEKRHHDRREDESSQISDERRRSSRRHHPERSHRAGEQHEINLEE
jgi:DNA-binding CsgD family transcriptional regulator